MSNECELQVEESKERLKTISNSELKAKITINVGTIIDVRSKVEYETNHIDKAISIPLAELEDNLDKFDKKEELNIICHSGKKASIAAKLLEDNGFTNVLQVIPGMKEW